MSLRPTRTRRTKVYDCNYNLGERYYKPVVDDLDRKYSGRPLSNADVGGGGGGGGLSSLRSALNEAEAEMGSGFGSGFGSGSGLRRAAREITPDEPEEAPTTRRRPLSALLEDFDSIYEKRNARSGGRSAARSAIAVLDDAADAEETVTTSSRLRAARARARQVEEEISSSVSSSVTTTKDRAGLDFFEKVLDTVGLKNSDIGKARRALAEDSFGKRTLKVTTSQPEDASFTKWTKVAAEAGAADDDFDAGAAAARARKRAKARLAEIDAELGSDMASGAAAARARQSRARLADLEAEMEAVADRTAARERRAAGLRALVAENEAASSEAASTSATLRVKKVSSTVQAEKKTVTF